MMFQILKEGGLIFTLPMTLIFMVNIVLIAKGTVFLLKDKFENQMVAKNWIDPIKYIAVFLLTVGILGQLIGLYSAFEVIGEKKIMLEPNILMQGIQVSSITTILGLFYFIISYGAWFFLSVKLKNSLSITS